MARYSLATLRGDCFGGLTAGVVALPLALAFGVASGAGAAAGLYGAIALGLFAALLGGTPVQISGPTGPMTVVAAAALAGFGGHRGALAAVIALAGLLQCALGLAGVGRLVRFMPYPVISGFMTGIGVIIILLQLGPLVGGAPAGSPAQAVMALPAAVAAIDPWSAGLGAATLAIAFGTPRALRRWLPPPLVALCVLGPIAWAADLPVARIGDIPQGLPAPVWPIFPAEWFGRVASAAASLAVLGAIDTLLTSVVADTVTGQRHDPRRELVGQGVGNAVAGLMGGLAGAGATMRTVVNVQAGGTTRVSGVLHALVLLAVLLGLGPLLAHVPMPVLAGILVKVGIDILDYRLLRVVRRAPRPDLIVMVTVLLTTVFVDLIVAVGVGVTLAALFLVHRMANATDLRITALDGEPATDPAAPPSQGLASTVRTVVVDGPFFFGSAAQVAARIERAAPAPVMLFDCLEVPFMDVSACFALQEAVEREQRRGTKVLVVVPARLRAQVLGMGLDTAPGRERVFTDRDTAHAAARRLANGG